MSIGPLLGLALLLGTLGGCAHSTGLEVIRIKPSRCEFALIAFTDANGHAMREIPVAPGTLPHGFFRAVQENYELTTAAMRRTYAGLSRLPTESRMLRD